MYPHVATGFSDSNAYLRELTLKSMLVLAPKLSQKTLTQSLLKFLAKLQVSLMLAMLGTGSLHALLVSLFILYLPHVCLFLFKVVMYRASCRLMRNRPSGQTPPYSLATWPLS